MGGDGTLGAPSFHDAGGAAPSTYAFLHGRPNTFVNRISPSATALVMSSIDAGGRIGNGPLVPIDTSAGKPSELCWLAVSPDDRSVFATKLRLQQRSAATTSTATSSASRRIPRARGFREMAPSELSTELLAAARAITGFTPDGAYLYQIYGNASKLVGYATQPDGSLTEITSVRIPYNSPEGLAGF